MPAHELERASTTEGLPVAPSLGPTLEATGTGGLAPPDVRRVVYLSGLAIALAVVAGLVAQLLTRLIAFFTNIAFYGRFSFQTVTPWNHQLGLMVLVVPVLGGLVVGVMARYGSKAIRGHGIPEAMEQVLTNKSRIPARMTVLKPLSAAICIGTGGPFGAEGPIIATGGALGSVLGQYLKVSASERKALLASGAAAGMAATFGSPVSAVLLAVELLLFEYRPASLIPCALAAATATGVRLAAVGGEPVFPMPNLAQPTDAALALYVVLGALVGVVAVGVTRAVYKVEDLFERLPIHWMWWPALGGLAVGAVGYVAPRTLGVGYQNIEDIVGGRMALGTIAALCGFKFVSWSISLGSGTSGGTLAPLFTFGGGVGTLLGWGLHELVPGAQIDLRIAALVGMAAIFAGASRALLASVVFAFETTRQPIGLLPLLGGCSAAFLVSLLLMRHTIMTEKIARRGVKALGEYSVDFLEQLSVKSCGLRSVVTLSSGDTLGRVQDWLRSQAPGTSHQGFPVVDEGGKLVGVLTRRDLLGDAARDRLIHELITRPPIFLTEDASLRDAADRMAQKRIGRLPIVSADDRTKVVGIITRSDLVEAHAGRLEEHRPEALRRLPRPPRLIKFS
jgi:H+/Cl- antiporter ClcA/predicted transcriptional regulator